MCAVASLSRSSGRRESEAQALVSQVGVSNDYFRTLQIPLRQGRTFDAHDRAAAPPAIVISESLARRYWPSGDALGSRIRIGSNPNAPLLEVVGIVGDVRNDPARPDPEPMLYRSNRQSPWPIVSVLLRTTGDPLALARAVERELAALDRGLPLQQPMTLDGVVGQQLTVRRVPVVLLAAFAAMALLLASVGVYAMFAGMAAAQEGEFAVRMALGSSRHAIVGLMLRQSAGWMMIGFAAGALGVGGVARLFRGMLYGVAPFDPIALGGAVIALVACATVALLIPLRRATHVEPATVLRAQ